MTTTPEVHAELLPVQPLPVGPHHTPVSPTALVDIGARMVYNNGMSTVAAQKTMDHLQRICLRVAVESVDAMLEQTHGVSRAKADELIQQILLIPNRLGYVSRDQVLMAVQRVLNAPARP